MGFEAWLVLVLFWVVCAVAGWWAGKVLGTAFFDWVDRRSVRSVRRSRSVRRGRRGRRFVLW